MTDRLLTAAEVADHFRVKKKTIYDWKSRGRIDPRYIFLTPGGRTRYHPDVLKLKQKLKERAA